MIITNRTEMACALNLEERVVFSYNLDDKSYRAGSSCRIKEGSHHIEAHLSMDYDVEGDCILYLSHPCDILVNKMHVSDWLGIVKKQTSPILSPGDKVAVLYYSEKCGVVFVRTLYATRKFNTDCSVVTILDDEGDDIISAQNYIKTFYILQKMREDMNK